MVNSTFARVVEELRTKSFVEGPVGLQAFLVTYEQMVAVFYNLGLRKAFCPQTEFICKALEITKLELLGIFEV